MRRKPMSEYVNPTAAETREFITKSEGNRTDGIYHDASVDHYPTHGLGINLQSKTSAFIAAYINALGVVGVTAGMLVKHYVYQNGKWVVDATVTDKTLLDEVIWLCNAANTIYLPFLHEKPEDGIAHEDNIVRVIADAADNNRAFDAVVYEAYLNSRYGIKGVIEQVGSAIWEKLTKEERLALYSLNYQLNSLIGPKLKAALDMYVNGETPEKKFIGRLNCWYEILYDSNKEGSGIRVGLENRRFMEANAFLGVIEDKKEAEFTQSKLQVANLSEATIVIAFMNHYQSVMRAYLTGIGGKYAELALDKVQQHFVQPIDKFCSLKYLWHDDINSLFTKWNIKTEADIDVVNGTVSYGNVTGTSLNDIIATVYEAAGRAAGELIEITDMEGNNTIEAGYAGYVIKTGGGYDNINAGAGNDVIYGGGGDDSVRAGDGNNEVHGGAGNDNLHGGKGDDYIYGDAGDDWIYGSDNDSFIGEGGNNHLYGGEGNDNIFGADGNDYIDAGPGIDFVNAGSGNNEIHLGQDTDNDYVNIGNFKGGIDRIYESDWHDQVSFSSGISIVSSGNVGADFVYKLSTGGKVILVGGAIPDPENKKGMPLFVMGDGNVKFCISADGQYVDSGYKLIKDKAGKEFFVGKTRKMIPATPERRGRLARGLPIDE